MYRIYLILLVTSSVLIAEDASAQNERYRIDSFLKAESNGRGEVRINSTDWGDFSLSKARIKLNESREWRIADAFAERLFATMGLEFNSTLQRTEVENTLRGGVKIFYQQSVNGKPVFDHGIWLSAFQYPTGSPEGISESGKRSIYSVSENHFENTPFTVDRVRARLVTKELSPPESKMSSVQAQEKVPTTIANSPFLRAEYGLQGRTNRGFRWAYRFSSDTNWGGTFSATVDAVSGEVLQTAGVAAGLEAGHTGISASAPIISDPLKTECTNLKLGKAFVNAYNIDNVTTPTNKYLLYLCDKISGYYYLDGKYVKVLNDNGAEITATDTTDFTGSYQSNSYSAPSVKFDEVSAYYHGSQFNAWMATNWQDYGYYLDYTMPHVTIKVNFASGVEVLGESILAEHVIDEYPGYYWTYEPEVFAHEMYHIHSNILESTIVGGNLIHVFENYAIGEGLADFWAIMYRKLVNPPTTMNKIMGTYVPSFSRDLGANNDWASLKTGEEEDYDNSTIVPQATHYDVAVVVGQVLWKFYELEGSDALDVVQISVSELNNAPDLIDLREAMETASDACYTSQGGIYCCTGSGCDDKVSEAFDARSITQYTHELTPNYYTASKGFNLTRESPIEEIELLQRFIVDAYPNPFNPSVNLALALPESGAVQIVIYDALGKMVHSINTEQLGSGINTLTWSPQNLASGTYFYSAKYGSETVKGRIYYLK